jgi:hypothetical protein
MTWRSRELSLGVESRAEAVGDAKKDAPVSTATEYRVGRALYRRESERAKEARDDARQFQRHRAVLAIDDFAGSPILDGASHLVHQLGSHVHAVRRFGVLPGLLQCLFFRRGLDDMVTARLGIDLAAIDLFHGVPAGTGAPDCAWSGILWHFRILVNRRAQRQCGHS